MAKVRRNFLFVDLAAQMDGAKPFDGMAAGEFIDMYGRKAKFKKEDLPTYVKNTKAVLASTKDESGQVVGLPIDAMNHDHREAAGWLVDVDLAESGEVILFSPRWNPLGEEMIGGDYARFFSPSVNLENMSIMGGSLTNWPATRDAKTGKILLRPVELSEQIYEYADESLPDRINRIARAFRDAFRDGFETAEAWPIDVFDDYVICEMGSKLYKVPFADGSDGLEFAEFSEWKEVRRSYVEAAMAAFKQWLSGLFKASESNGGDEPQGEPAPELPVGDPKMPDPIELSAEQRALFEAEVQKRANVLFQQAMEQEQRKTRILDFTRTVTGKGLAVQGEDLTAFLSSLTPEQLEKAEALFSKIVEAGGTIDFEEHGHSREMHAAQPLPDWAKAQLSAWLSAGKDLPSFFAVNAVELGLQSDYDLKEFEKEK